MTDTTDGRDDETTNELVNYLPAIPTVSREPGRVGQFLVDLVRRRRIGALRVRGHERNGE
jgi:hypothetical protein